MLNGLKNMMETILPWNIAATGKADLVFRRVPSLPNEVASHQKQQEKGDKVASPTSQVPKVSVDESNDVSSTNEGSTNEGDGFRTIQIFTADSETIIRHSADIEISSINNRKIQTPKNSTIAPSDYNESSEHSDVPLNSSSVKSPIKSPVLSINKSVANTELASAQHADGFERAYELFPRTRMAHDAKEAFEPDDDDAFIRKIEFDPIRTLAVFDMVKCATRRDVFLPIAKFVLPCDIYRLVCLGWVDPEDLDWADVRAQFHLGRVDAEDPNNRGWTVTRDIAVPSHDAREEAVEDLIQELSSSGVSLQGERFIDNRIAWIDGQDEECGEAPFEIEKEIYKEIFEVFFKDSGLKEPEVPSPSTSATDSPASLPSTPSNSKPADKDKNSDDKQSTSKRFSPYEKARKVGKQRRRNRRSDPVSSLSASQPEKAPAPAQSDSNEVQGASSSTRSSRKRSAKEAEIDADEVSPASTSLPKKSRSSNEFSSISAPPPRRINPPRAASSKSKQMAHRRLSGNVSASSSTSSRDEAADADQAPIHAAPAFTFHNQHPAPGDIAINQNAETSRQLHRHETTLYGDESGAGDDMARDEPIIVAGNRMSSIPLWRETSSGPQRIYPANDRRNAPSPYRRSSLHRSDTTLVNGMLKNGRRLL